MIPDNSRLVTVWRIDAARCIWYHFDMSFYYVMTTTETSVLQGNAPTYNAIVNALQALQINGGEWLGPGPRVVRSFSVGLSGNITNVTWAFALDAPYDQAGADSAAQVVGAQAQIALLAVSSDFSTVAVTPLDPTLNGTADWWSSGQAAATQTRDNFPELGARLSAGENPVGPDTSATTLPTLGGGIGDLLNKAAPPGSAGAQVLSFLTTAMYFAAGGVALYFLWPVLTGARNVASSVVDANAPTERRRRSQRARNNPRRRRAKRLSAFHTR